LSFSLLLQKKKKKKRERIEKEESQIEEKMCYLFFVCQFRMRGAMRIDVLLPIYPPPLNLKDYHIK
jgi:hypothetical protein